MVESVAVRAAAVKMPTGPAAAKAEVDYLLSRVARFDGRAGKLVS